MILEKMNSLKMMVCLVALLVGSLAVTASADVIVDEVDPIVLDPAGTNGVSLTNLLEGDSIIVGDKLFSDFEAVFSAGGLATLPASGDIHIFGSQNTNGDYGIRFNMTGFNVASGDSKNATIQFAVTATDPNLFINDVSMTLTGGAAAGSGVASIVEGVFDQKNGAPFLQSGQNLFVGDSASFDQLFDEDFLTEAAKSIWVVKDIGVAGNQQGIAHISDFTQHFSQVPEPASIVLFLGGAALIYKRRKA